MQKLTTTPVNKKLVGLSVVLAEFKSLTEESLGQMQQQIYLQKKKKKAHSVFTL